MSNASWMNDDFLLETDCARRLYHEFAEALPIVDFHCHLSPALIAQDHRFADLAEIWLGGDHYKWRAMRACGVPERYCTGDAPPWEKFQKWAEVVPQLLRNPIYHWTHLELRRPFGIADRVLNPVTAESIWKECNEKLAQPAFSARGIMKSMKVTLVCTTDDPTDSLEHHRAIAQDSAFAIRVLPTWRPDRAMAIETPAAFNAWIDALAAATNREVATYDDYLEALRERQSVFHEHGCRLSDHGLSEVPSIACTSREAAVIFTRVREGASLAPDETVRFRGALLHELLTMNHRFGWTQQLHVGALRNVNSRMFERLGPDTGYDSISDAEVVRPLAAVLDRLEREGCLTRTIAYNLNPRDNEAMVTMLGNFQDGETPGRMQHGAAWWFLDQADGMRRQLEALSQLGVLSQFVGMVTDSRSFLSYTRHEYFRRLVCNILGDEMARGLLPSDFALVGALVRAICHDNAATYFRFGAEENKVAGERSS